MFVKNTKILDDTDNLIDISMAYPQLLIKGYDFNNSNLVSISIKKLIVATIPNYIKITIGNTIICCNPNSLFYTLEGWAAYNNITVNNLYNINSAKLTTDSKVLNINNRYIKVDSIEEIEEEVSVLGLDTEDTNDTFIVENFVVHNIPILYSKVNQNFIANTVLFNLPYSSIDSFNWHLTKLNGVQIEPPITATVTNEGFSYPAFTYQCSTNPNNPKIANGSYTVVGQA